MSASSGRRVSGRRRPRAAGPSFRAAGPKVGPPGRGRGGGAGQGAGGAVPGPRRPLHRALVRDAASERTRGAAGGLCLFNFLRAVQLRRGASAHGDARPSTGSDEGQKRDPRVRLQRVVPAARSRRRPGQSPSEPLGRSRRGRRGHVAANLTGRRMVRWALRGALPRGELPAAAPAAAAPGNLRERPAALLRGRTRGRRTRP